MNNFEKIKSDLRKIKEQSPVSLEFSGKRAMFPVPEKVKDGYFAYILDFDAPTPSNPTSSPYVHQIAIYNQKDKTWVDQVEYVGPSPPAHSPPHEYFLIITTESLGGKGTTGPDPSVCPKLEQMNTVLYVGSQFVAPKIK